MTTQDKITHIMLLARHLLNAPEVQLRVRTSEQAGEWWMVWLEHEGFKLYADGDRYITPTSFEEALDTLLAELTLRAHRKMEEVSQILERLK